MTKSRSKTRNFSDLIKSTLTPMLLANIFLSVIAGGYLVAQGAWQVLYVFGLAIFMGPYLVFPFFMIPAGFLTGVMAAAKSVAPRVSVVFAFLGMIYLVAMLSLWATYAFDSVELLIEKKEMQWLSVAALVWASCVSIVPWAIFARRDTANVLFTSLVFITQVACIVTTVLSYLYTLNFEMRFWILAGIVGGLTGAQALYEEFILGNDLHLDKDDQTPSV